MAKKSTVAREAQKVATAKRFAEKVSKIKAAIREGNDETRQEAIIMLNKLPRNASQCRQHRRCRMCGRPRGVYRTFGLCRICLRKAAMRGDVPGLVKASW